MCACSRADDYLQDPVLFCISQSKIDYCNIVVFEVQNCNSFARRNCPSFTSYHLPPPPPPPWLFTYLLTYLFTYLLTWLLTYLFGYLLTYFVTYLLGYLVTYLHAAQRECIVCIHAVKGQATEWQRVDNVTPLIDP